jgi:hypothetical protein
MFNFLGPAKTKIGPKKTDESSPKQRLKIVHTGCSFLGRHYNIFGTRRKHEQFGPPPPEKVLKAEIALDEK